MKRENQIRLLEVTTIAQALFSTSRDRNSASLSIQNYNKAVSLLQELLTTDSTVSEKEQLERISSFLERDLIVKK